MSTFKISCLLAVILIGGATAKAQTGHQVHRSVSSSDMRRHYVSGAFGFLAPGANSLVGTVNGIQQQPIAFTNSGFFGIGGDYDYMLNKDFSIGGVLRYYNCSSTISGVSYQDTLFTLGPSARAYLPTGDFVPYLSAGFMYMSPGATIGPNTYNITSGIGLMMSMGLLYNVSEGVALGIETMRLTGLSSSINGNLIEDYMLKGRFAIGN